MITILTKDNCYMFNQASFAHEKAFIALLDNQIENAPFSNVALECVPAENFPNLQAREITDIYFEPRHCDADVVRQIERLTQ